MAAGYRVRCGKCTFTLLTWDEGNPYVEFPEGERHYFHHPVDNTGFKTVRRILKHEPSHEEYKNFMEKYVGNAPDHLCLDCGKITKLNPDVDKLVCPKCNSDNIVKTGHLNGKQCPFCDGTLIKDKEISAIS
jgi:DNA-directed RNA polymerase subunit RPC12/RpoP